MGYPAGASTDPNAPWNKVGQIEERHFKGEAYIQFDGMDYFIIGDGYGYYSIFLSDDETNTDLCGMIPKDLEERIIEKLIKTKI